MNATGLINFIFVKMPKSQKRVLCILILMALRCEIYAQSYYMHEVAEDAGYCNSVLSFLEALQWIVILGIGLLFLVGFGIGWIKEQFETPSSTLSTPQVDPNKIVSKGEFYNGWARFKTHCGKYGYINTNGSILKCISPNDTHFNGVQYFSEAEEFVHDIVIVQLGNWKYALINKFGRNVNNRYEKSRNDAYIKELENGLIYYERRNHQHHDVFNHECYVYNRKGDLVYDGALKDIKVNKDGNLEIKNNEGVAIMTPQGKFITPFCRKNSHLKGSLYKVFSSKGPCGVFDNSKQQMILPYADYGNILYIHEQNLLLCSQYRKTGYERGWYVVDIKGNVLFSINAERVEVLNEKCLLITQSDGSGHRLQGVFSFNGENIVPLLYDEILGSVSATEFLAKSANQNHSFDYKYTLYNIDGKVVYFDTFSYVRYYTMGGLASSEGTIRGLDVYSSDNDYIREVDCPAFIELTKKMDNNVQVGIVNMKNEVIIPATYIDISEIRNTDRQLIGFKAFTKGSNYAELDLEGNKKGEGNSIRDQEIDEYLNLMLPGYQSELHRSIEEDAWFSHLEMLEDDDNYNDDVFF